MMFRKNTPFPGFLVTVEGIDGAGKTTVVEALADEFEDTTMTGEPSAHWTGDQVYRAIQNDSGVDTPPLGTFFLYMADRVKHIAETIRPALEAGDMVISDRYADSTYAYQQHALETALEANRQTPYDYIKAVMDPWMLTPDVTLYIDISVDTARKRMGGDDEYENREFLAEVKENYARLYQTGGDRWVRIDGDQPMENVVEDAVAVIKGRKTEYDGFTLGGIADT